VQQYSALGVCTKVSGHVEVKKDPWHSPFLPQLQPQTAVLAHWVVKMDKLTADSALPFADKFRRSCSAMLV
jgi:hypothetical protein